MRVSHDDGMVFVAMVLGLLVVWAAAAVALALLTGGVIHERDVHDRRPAPRRSGRVAL